MVRPSENVSPQRHALPAKAIVVPDSTPLEKRDPGLGYRALWRLGAAMDPLVWTRTEFDSRLHLRASLPATIQREGKLLYAA